MPAIGTGPLHGHRVIELGTAITAPYATMLLGDLGAEVVKVEGPKGDPFRVWDGSGPSPRFAAFNRDKRSVVVDLKSTGGQDQLNLLVGSADALVTNFRPSTLRRLGADAETLTADHPSLVYCEITGAADGPGADRPMYDAVVQGLSGLMSMTSGLQDPQPIGPALTDSICGALSAVATAGALVERVRSGRGQVIRTSMVEACLNFLAESLTDYFSTGTSPTPSTRPTHSQAYGFVCRDGLPLVIHLSTPDKFWHGLLRVVERVELVNDPRFRTYGYRVNAYDALREELAPVFRTAERATWLDRLAAADVPAAPVHNLGSALADPVVAHLGMTSSVRAQGGEDVTVVHSPWRAGWEGEHRAPPALGADTANVLDALTDDPAATEQGASRG